MAKFERISVEKARHIMTTDNVAIVDIRDRVSFNNGHIENALLLDNNNIDGFVTATDKNTTIIIYCYHGNSSQNAAQFIAEQGFSTVYSMDGGFELWT